MSIQTRGGYVVNITVAPGVVAADGTIDLPVWAPPIARTGGGLRQLDAAAGGFTGDSGVIGATIFTIVMGSATPLYASTDLNPVVEAADIAAGSICRVDHNTVRVGTAVGGDELISICYIAAPADSTVG